MSELLPIRRSSRLFIVSSSGRLLLFRYSDEHSAPFWSTVGGELVGDESFQNAAERELHEETGFSAKVGRLLRERDDVFAVARSEPARWQEMYFLVQVDCESMPRRDNWTDEERSTIVECKWWSVDDFLHLKPSVKPDWIPSLLEEVVR